MKRVLLLLILISSYSIAEQIIIDEVFVEKQSSDSVLAKKFALNSGVKNLVEKIAVDFYPNSKFTDSHNINFNIDLNYLRHAIVAYSISDEKFDSSFYSAKLKYILDYEYIKPIIREIESRLTLKTYLIIPLKLKDDGFKGYGFDDEFKDYEFKYDDGYNNKGYNDGDIFEVDEELLSDLSRKISNYKHLKTLDSDINRIKELNYDYNNEELDFFKEKFTLENNVDEIITVKSFVDQDEVELEYIPSLKSFETFKNSNDLKKIKLKLHSSAVDDIIYFINNPIRDIKFKNHPQVIHCIVRDSSNWKYIKDFLSNFNYIIKNVENDNITLDIYHKNEINTFFKIAKRHKIDLKESNDFLEIGKK